MDRRRQILSTLRRGARSGTQLRTELRISRQALHKHLKKLVLEGLVLKAGGTKNARYLLAAKKRPPVLRQVRYVTLHGLDESAVFQALSRKANLQESLRENVFDILHFAFTEMLNNAIDHSRSRRAQLELRLTPYDVRFSIRDYGVGVYASIASMYGLTSEREAAGELLKGKTTTFAERHSGEGIFFTSRAGDRFALRSHGIELEFDNHLPDIFLKVSRPIKGTLVTFSIGRNARRQLKNVFDEFAPPEHDYRFEKTKIAVRLFQENYVSRTEAKRLLSGLEKFKEVVLDFQKVRTIGQGFADEIFRVFKNAHPEVSIVVVHAAPVIEQMVRHVVDRK